MALNLEELDAAISRASQQMYRAVAALSHITGTVGALAWDDIQAADNALGMTRKAVADLSAVVTKLSAVDGASAQIDARLAAKAGFADVATMQAHVVAVETAAAAYNAARESLYASWSFTAAEVVTLGTVGNPAFRFTTRADLLEEAKADQLRALPELSALIAAFGAAGVVA